jgi:hypothetical protein
MSPKRFPGKNRQKDPESRQMTELNFQFQLSFVFFVQNQSVKRRKNKKVKWEVVTKNLGYDLRLPPVGEDRCRNIPLFWEISPQPVNHPIWARLKEAKQKFACGD